MNMEYRATFRQTVSVRERIINDSDSTATLLQMVQVAHAVLVEDIKYIMYRRVMVEVVLKHQGLRETIKDVIWREILSCGEVEQDQKEGKERSPKYSKDPFAENKAIGRIVDKFSIELLRFLAMKVLLESILTTGEGVDCQSVPLTTGANRYPSKEYSIVPSMALRDGWEAMILLPKLYSNICTVMGCKGSLDYSTYHLVLNYQGNREINYAAVKEARQHYRYTMITYEKLYLVIPDENIWSRLEDDDEEDRDTTFHDGCSDLLDGISSYLRGKITSKERAVPDTIRFTENSYL